MADLDTRTLRHAALVNGESSCRLSSSRDGHKLQRIGGGLADRSIIPRLSVKARKARFWRLHESQPREEEGEVQGRLGPLHTLPYLFLVH